MESGGTSYTNNHRNGNICPKWLLLQWTACDAKALRATQGETIIDITRFRAFALDSFIISPVALISFMVSGCALSGESKTQKDLRDMKNKDLFQRVPVSLSMSKHIADILCTGWCHPLSLLSGTATGQLRKSDSILPLLYDGEMETRYGFKKRFRFSLFKTLSCKFRSVGEDWRSEQ
ncbi:hypothetical protein RRG08_055062 [Elysia crispata]|uniref:Uncharacterized protein n=1 Tax=Elysia crispata TaxID=231223 RepID=A0AAE1B1A5_9GAST|nr:hypothetical protein RRG08_055062 [Elysia crispata]